MRKTPTPPALWNAHMGEKVAGLCLKGLEGKPGISWSKMKLLRVQGSLQFPEVELQRA